MATRQVVLPAIVWIELSLRAAEEGWLDIEEPSGGKRTGLGHGFRRR